MSLRRVLALAVIAGCQGKSEPDPPRPPPAVIEARAGNATAAHIIAGHPCRAEIDGDEMLIGTQPLVAQVGNDRWTGDDITRPGDSSEPPRPRARTDDERSQLGMAGTGDDKARSGARLGGSAELPDATVTLRRNGVPMVRIHNTQDAAIEVFDPQGAAILRLSSDGTVANGRGEIVRRAEVGHLTIKVGDAVITGTTDAALGVLITAPELIPEVRALAACHRLYWREQVGRK